MNTKQKTYNKKLGGPASSSERLEIQIKAIGDISNSIAGVADLEKVLTMTVENIIGGWGLKMPSIYLKDDLFLGLKAFKVPKTILRMVEVAIGGKVYEKVGHRIEDNDNILIEALNTKKILQSDSLHDFVKPLMSERLARGLQHAMSLRVMLAIPLYVKDEVFGVMAVSSVDREIIDLDKKGVEAIANQISIAIYNARLFSKVQNQVDQLDAKSRDIQSLYEMSKAAIKKNKTQDTVQELLDTIPQQFSHLGYVGAGFFTYEEDTREIKVNSMTSGDVFEQLTSFSMNGEGSTGYSVEKHPESMFAKALLQEEYITFEDFSLLNPKTKNKKKVQKLQKDLGIQSGIMLKIFLRGLIPGIFFVATKRPVSDISERDERIMHSLANNFSLAYENAQLYQKTIDQLEEVKHANSELKQLDEAKSNFVSIASHQLRTPVSGVRGYLSMLYEGDFGELKPKQKEIVEMNLANLERLNKLIDTFLDVTKIEAGKLVLDMELCNLSEIIESVIGEFSHQVTVKNIDLTFRSPEKKSAVMCDPERIRHAIANLIDNSIKYTEEGSVEVSLTVKSGKERITVKDTGVGIKSEEAKHLFEKFVRASGGSRINANGSGLGLYIVKKIIEGHDGKVWVESEGEGKGSSFIIELERSSEKKRVKRKKGKK